MKKVLKNPIFMFILGILITLGIVGAYAISASEITYNNTTVDAALNDLYGKVGGYAALFSTNRVCSTTHTIVPISYENNKYFTSSNNVITITKSGKYQVIGTVSHARTGNTTVLAAYLNNTIIGEDDNILTYSAHHNLYEYVILNKELTLNEGDQLYFEMVSDGNYNDVMTGATVVLIKI